MGKRTQKSKRYKNHTQTVLFRLVLTFVLIWLPIFILELYTFQMGMNTLDEQINRSLEQQISFKLQELSSQMQLAQTQLRHMTGERDVLRLSGMHELMDYYDQTYQLNRLQERIGVIRNANSAVHQIDMYLSRLDKRLRSVSLGYMYSTITPMDEQEFDLLWQQRLASPHSMIYTGERLIYIDQQPITLALSSEKRPRIMYVIEYDLSVLDSCFSQILSDMDSGYCLIFDDGQVLNAGTQPEWMTELVAPLTALSDEEKAHTLDWSDGSTYVMSCYSDVLKAHCVVYAARANAFAELHSFRTLLVVLPLVFMIALIIYAFRAYVDVHTPLKLLTGAFGRLAQGDMDFQVHYDKMDEFRELTDRFNLMLQQLKTTMQQLYQQRILMQQARIKQLQAQINPHFLYNSLFILENMIAMEDCANASLFSRKLGEYFHYVTRDARDMVSLAEELDHVRSYVEVQRTRFGSRLKIDFPSTPPAAADVLIPRLTLQPILENAFVHALERNSCGALEVRLLPDGERFRVEIANTGFHESQEWLADLQSTLDDEDPTREVTGLINVHRRLKLTHQTGLQFRPEPPDLLVVTLTLQRNITEEDNGLSNGHCG